jgi:transcriptional regulator with XRE-family HTH domain
MKDATFSEESFTIVRKVAKIDTMSSEIVQLVATIKRQLKAQGFTYRDVARSLKVSEASIKRTFANESYTLGRLAQVSEFLGFTLAELLQTAATAVPPLDTLTTDQETQLVSDDKLILVAVCALNHWSLADILSFYDMTKMEAIKRLRILDRMCLIELLPGDRIRRRAKRDFDWIQDGPIRRYFAEQGLTDFIAGPFDPKDESLDFAHGMLTPAAQAELKLEVRRLRAKLSNLHEQCIPADISEKRGVGVLLALRRWEPIAFARLRREPPSACFVKPCEV